MPSLRHSQTYYRTIKKCLLFEPEYALTLEAMKLSGQGEESALGNHGLVFPFSYQGILLLNASSGCTYSHKFRIRFCY